MNFPQYFSARYKNSKLFICNYGTLGSKCVSYKKPIGALMQIKDYIRARFYKDSRVDINNLTKEIYSEVEIVEKYLVPYKFYSVKLDQYNKIKVVE